MDTKPPPVVVTPAYLPPATGEQCPRCSEDLLKHDRLGIVCRSGHAPSCDCAAHDVGPACPAMTPTITTRPITSAELARLAKSGHGRCQSRGFIIRRAVGDKPGGPTEKRGLCSCSHKRVRLAIEEGRLVEVDGCVHVPVEQK